MAGSIGVDSLLRGQTDGMLVFRSLGLFKVEEEITLRADV